MFSSGIETTQKNKYVKITCDGIKDAVVIRADINEKISDLFKINVILQSADLIDTSVIINKNASISVEYFDKKFRYFSGIVSKASLEVIPSKIKATNKKVKFANNILLIEIVPTLFRCDLSNKYRIFQQLSAVDIIDKILKENKITNVKKNITSAGKTKREFSVQYDESDFYFISRLMEEEGIIYWFEHEKDKDILCLSDKSMSSKKLEQSLEVLKHYSEEFLFANYVYNVSTSDSVGIKKITSLSFNEDKAKSLKGSAENSSLKYTIGEKEIFDKSFDDSSFGNSISKTILETDNCNTKVLQAQSSCPILYAGCLCNIKNPSVASQNGDFLVIESSHTINQLVNNTNSSTEKQSFYENKFKSIPGKTPFRAAQRHKKQRIFGVQTAIVTGTSGEEIFCDNKARVKIKFHWDTRSKDDEKSSCWIRVAQNWSGKGFGSLVIPRVGMEVLVTFVNGDPDHPIITGCVYNGVNKPPSDYAEKKKTASTFYTNSSKGSNGFNEIRIDDKKGAEEIYIHAQKDIVSVVQDNVTQTLNKGNRTITLESKKDKVKDSLTIKKGDKVTTISEGNLEIVLDKGNCSITLKEGNKTITLNKGNLSIKIDGDISISANNIKIDASKDISINSKGSFSVDSMKSMSYSTKDTATFKTTKDFVVDASMNVKINAKMNLNLESKIALSEKSLNIKREASVGISDKANATLTIESSAMATFKGGAMTTIQAGAMMAVKGAIVKLN